MNVCTFLFFFLRAAIRLSIYPLVCQSWNVQLFRILPWYVIYDLIIWIYFGFHFSFSVSSCFSWRIVLLVSCWVCKLSYVSFRWYTYVLVRRALFVISEFEYILLFHIQLCLGFWNWTVYMRSISSPQMYL